MSQIDQTLRHKTSRDVAEQSEIVGQVSFYSPSPAFQVVVISKRNLLSDRLTSPQMVDLANQTVKELALSPSEVIWIEQASAPSGLPSRNTYSLINFDWHAGQATSLHRSPIYEDWYLSWLEKELSL